jgi:hypothetical protein
VRERQIRLDRRPIYVPRDVAWMAGQRPARIWIPADVDKTYSLSDSDPLKAQ